MSCLRRFPRVLTTVMVVAVVSLLLMGGFGILTAHAAPLSSGSQFTVSIGHTTPAGASDTISCRFEVVSGNTVMVKGAGTLRGARAIATTTTGSITIPQTVTYQGETYTVVRIGDYAFGGDASSNSCSQLTGVVLPSSLQRIGTYAFAHNTQLKTIEFPSALATFDSYSLYACTSLTALDFPSSVSSIGSYAFNRCSGIKTVTFRGNAPTCGSYVFVGDGVAIEKVIYYGSKISNPTNLFNSREVAQPEFFYTVRFFESLTAARTGSPIGTATVSEQVFYIDIRSDLDAARIYGGSVPALPGTSNLWLFEGNPNLGSTINNSCYAYALRSNYNNLSLGRVQTSNSTYTGLNVDANVVVYDMLGTLLREGRHYEVTYYRQSATQAGQWVVTEDRAGPGTVRAVVQGISGGLYSGSLTSEFTISLGTGTFVRPIPYTTTDGTSSTVYCAFRILSLNETSGTGGGSGTVRVSRADVPFPADLGGGIAAVPDTTIGSITIPSEIQIGNYRFTVIEIGPSSFAGQLITGITIPATIKSFGNEAFNGCVALRTLIYEGDASSNSYGDSCFALTSLSAVVYGGKKEQTVSLYPGNPTRYYTITFYKDRQSALAPATTPLGKMMIRQDVKLALVPSISTRLEGVWSGQAPAYPPELINDGSWYAPTWIYPEANPDNQVAMRSTLSDSTYAYAAQTNDVYSIADAVVIGLEPNQQFAYLSKPVIKPLDVTVCGIAGGKLRLGVDFLLNFERLSPQGVWTATSDFIQDGSLRAVIIGIGGYTGVMYIPFSIVVAPGNLGDVVYASIPLVTPEGLATTVECRFEITSVADGRLEVSVIGSGYDTNALAAVPFSAAGRLTIPTTINYNSLNYTVTGIGAHAFGNSSRLFSCELLTEIVLPSTIRSIGTSAFQRTTGMKRIVVPSGLIEESRNVFHGSGVEEVVLGNGNTAIGGFAFLDCVNLKSIVLPSSLKSIEGYYESHPEWNAQSFSGCIALESVTIGSGLTDWEGAFQNLVSIKEVIAPNGVRDIPERAFKGCTGLEVLELSGSVTSISTQAFFNTGLNSVVLPGSLAEMASGAFGSSQNLETVTFAGDADTMRVTAPFISSTHISDVLFMGTALTGYELRFPAATRFYAKTSFYGDEASASDADGDGHPDAAPLGSALVLCGTVYRDIRSDRIDPAAIYKGDVYGMIPALPAGKTLWRFAGDPAMNARLSDSLYAWASDINPKDLSFGKVVALESYHYTGLEINPFASTTPARVVDADGTILDVAYFTPSFERRDSLGVWLTSGDLISNGAVQMVATATGAGGYFGQARGIYTIAPRTTGESFVADDPYGNTITYHVLNYANDIRPGTVQVGRGTTGATAVPAGTAGPVEIPDVVYDPDGYAYRPTTIAPYAFYRCMRITALVLPSGLTEVGVSAFATPWQSSDTQPGALATVVFKGDLTRVSFAANAFDSCSNLSTIVYGGKKGSFTAFGTSPTISRYYTVRFYASSEDREADIAQQTLILKEGAPVDSPSPTDYWPGTVFLPEGDTLPVPPSGSRWRFEAGTLGANRSATDSLYAVARAQEENIIVQDVPVTLAGVTTWQPCTFSVIFDDDDQPTTTVQVGRGVDGQPAVDRALTGTVHIPAEIRDDEGTTYQVVAVGDFAFGASFVEEAASISGIELPWSVNVIERAAFMNCPNLAEVIIAHDADDGGAGSDGSGGSGSGGDAEEPGGLRVIEPYAFADTPALAYVDLPEGITTIGDAAFQRSGLKAIEVPYSVVTLGRQAFEGCASLEEIVFGGIMPLDLTPLGGLTFSTAQTDAEPVNSTGPTRLAALNDYVLANCPALRRLVFEADVSRLVTSSSAFTGSGALEAVVFNERGCDITFASADPQFYVTASYFNSREDLQRLTRAGYLCIARDNVLDPLDSAIVYAGTIPVLPEGFIWRYSRNEAMPVGDSCTAYRSKIGYLLDTSAIDAAFGLNFRVNGVAADAATVDDLVEVTIVPQGAAQVARLLITDSRDGSVIVDTAELSSTFLMPDAPVNFALEAALDLRVYRQPLNGSLKEVGVLTLPQMQELVSSDERRYSAWNDLGQRLIITTQASLKLVDLLAALGLNFEPGDSLAVQDVTGQVRATTYESLMGAARYCFPNIATGEQEAAVEVEPVIALTYSAIMVSADNPVGVALDGGPSMAGAYRLLYGQTAEELAGRRDTASGLAPKLVSLTLIKGAVELSDCVVSGLESSYYYTGAALEPHPTLTDQDGNVLAEGVDYAIAWQNNANAGTGRVILTGAGFYKGTAEIGFPILRAQSLAGSVREETAKAIALDAYPTGSNGAILASSAVFADALSASGLAGMLGYPVVLTAPTALSAAARDTLSQLSAGHDGFEVIIVGGTPAVSAQVEQAVKTLLSNRGYINRLAGADRFETSQEIFFHGMMVGQWSETLVVATGYNFPDALSIAPYAAFSHTPIFLTNGQAISEYMLDDMKSGGFKNAIIVGSEAVVSSTIANQLASVVGAGNVNRLAGADRYATSLAIARWELDHAGMTLDGAAIATGSNFPDALAGASLLGKSGSVLLLAEATNTSTLALLAEQRDSVRLIRFLGSETVVPRSVQTTAVDALQWDRKVLN